MDILKEIQELTKKNILITYEVVNQKENGTTMDESIHSFTVYIEYNNNYIWSESFDNLEEGLREALKNYEKAIIEFKNTQLDYNDIVIIDGVEAEIINFKGSNFVEVDFWNGKIDVVPKEICKKKYIIK